MENGQLFQEGVWDVYLRRYGEVVSHGNGELGYDCITKLIHGMRNVAMEHIGAVSRQQREVVYDTMGFVRRYSQTMGNPQLEASALKYHLEILFAQIGQEEELGLLVNELGRLFERDVLLEKEKHQNESYIMEQFEKQRVLCFVLESFLQMDSLHCFLEIFTEYFSQSIVSDSLPIRRLLHLIFEKHLRSLLVPSK